VSKYIYFTYHNVVEHLMCCTQQYELYMMQTKTSSNVAWKCPCQLLDQRPA